MEKLVNEMVNQGIIHEMFDELGGAMVFTKLDLRAGYHQIRVYDRDVYKTAFRTHDGHYEFLGFKWGESESKDFKELKDKLTHAPILGLSDFKDKFVIEAYVSDVGIRAVLLQKGCLQMEAILCWTSLYNSNRSSESQGAYATAGTNATPTKIRKETYGFDFDNEYKPGTSNIVADALSWVFEDDEKGIASFMALSRPVMGLLAELKRENEHLDELCQIHRWLDQGEILDGFWREQGLLLFCGDTLLGPNLS
uniref:Reverse transcriptase/retrotransposon-derived protein RNase H-like domain-containing protein n=1 Tax=Tanacetum cinerariifolium TaxID=118510 RepID=A0A699KXD2_TANCI|nr:hypothetical protein [Tanacetum cinerariifolium]